MTYASVRAAVEHIARVGTITPHQLAAFTALWESMSEQQKQEFTDSWRAEGSPANPRPPIWLEPAHKIVSEYEGCRLGTYLCPAGIPTIGYGHTGPEVKMGMTITQQRADALLEKDLYKFAAGVHQLIPVSRNLGGNQQAALISWAYNVGLGAVEGSTLRKRLAAGESPIVVVQQELPRWNKDGSEVLLGLVRRRAAEVALFLGQAPAGPKNPLQVPFYSQLDSSTDQARRMCFSSSCAMLLEFLRPGLLKGPNGDDQYLQRVQKFGDTTSAIAQLNALKSYSIDANFIKNGSVSLIEKKISEGVPVPCGYLHRGPVNSPSGGGHYLIIVGYDKTHFIVHDPLGEADLLTGATINKQARFSRYSKQNFCKRWEVKQRGDGTYYYEPGNGWAIIAKR